MSAIAGKVGAVYQNYSGTDKSKLIADFQSDETWVADSSELVTNDTTNFRLGNKSIKLQDNDDTSNITSMILGSITLDIAQFESGASSDTNDYIYMIFYVNLSTYFNNVGLDFSTGSFDPNNRYTYNVTTLVDGWNYVKVKKSLFATTGSPSWSGIQSIRAKASTKVGANSAGAYVSFQSLYLIDDSYDFALANNTAYTLEQICLFYNWDLDIESDIEEITTFCSDGWKTFLPTLNGFTVSAEKYWANGDYLDNINTDFVLSLYTNTTTGQRYDGLAKVQSDSITTGVNAIVEEAIGFQGDGDLYYTDVQIIDS